MQVLSLLGRKSRVGKVKNPKLGKKSFFCYCHLFDFAPDQNALLEKHLIQVGIGGRIRDDNQTPFSQIHWLKNAEIGHFKKRELISVNTEPNPSMYVTPLMKIHRWFLGD